MAAAKRCRTYQCQLQNCDAPCPAKCRKVCPVADKCAWKKPVRVLVTGAAGNIAYSILFPICNGDMLGNNQPIDLVLLDIPPMEKVVKGVVMELQDCAYPLVNSLTATSDYRVAFKDIEYALLIGSRPRGPGMERKDLLRANAAIFKGQGKALNDYAARNVKVLVVGNPANTNCLIAMRNAPNLPKTAFTAMTRLDQNRATSLLADKLRVPLRRVNNVVIWGNHSSTMYPDVSGATIADYPQRGMVTPLKSALNDEAYLKGAFLKTIQQRGAAIITARGKSSAASAAQAAMDHMRSWALGTKDGQFVSMGVYSDGKTYGVPEGLIYSFPCVCKNGEYQIVRGVSVCKYSQSMLDITTKELLEEREQALS